MRHTFKIVGKIRGKARPRFNVYTKKVYTTPQDREFESLIRQSYIESDGLYFNGNIRAEIDLYFAIPKSYTKKRRELCAKNIEKPSKKPDIDNVLKSIFDSCNKIAYHDDTQIVEVEARKHYTSGEEHMIITFIQL